jgi:hypothetical protein
MLKSSSLCLYSSNVGTFWLKIEQQWTIEEISIFSNSSHLEWRAGLSDINLKGNHPGTIPARFGLIWFSGFRGEDLNAIFYQNMPNLHNRYISADPLSKICPVIPTSNQDGRQAKNRKKGGLSIAALV